MTKQYFEAIAAIVKTNLDISDHSVERMAVKGVATDMADLFAANNPRFDRKKFLTACGF